MDKRPDYGAGDCTTTKRDELAKNTQTTSALNVSKAKVVLSECMHEQDRTRTSCLYPSSVISIRLPDRGHPSPRNWHLSENISSLRNTNSQRLLQISRAHLARPYHPLTSGAKNEPGRGQHRRRPPPPGIFLNENCAELSSCLIPR